MHLVLLPLLSIVLQANASPPHRNERRAATGLTSPDKPTMTGTISSCSLWYTVVSGDDCPSVEKAFGISHKQFITWNPAVSDDCATNFWTDESYCVGVSSSTAPATASQSTEKTSAPPVTSASTAQTRTTHSCPDKPTMTGAVSNCNAWYDIVSGDDCDNVPAAFNMTREQFLEWNPAISSDCETNFWENEAYCVGTGTAAVCTPTQTPTQTPVMHTTSATHMTTPTGTYSPLSYASANYTPVAVDTAWPPSKTQEGQPSYCTKWHRVRRGDTCESIRGRYSRSISLQDLLEWNPALEDDCSGLYIDWWVCVGIQPQTSVLNTDVYTSTYTSWTETPLPSVDYNFTPTPTQSGLVEGCQAFYQAEKGDTCSNITSNLGYINEQQLLAWNPALSDSCSGMTQGYYYCVASFTALPLPAMVTATPTATQSGIVSSCVAWYQTTPGDDCDLIPEMFTTFTKEEFLSWNPALQSNCSGMVIGDYYCVAIPGTATTQTKYTYSSITPYTAPATSSSAVQGTSTSPTSTGAVGTPSPVQSGMVSGCRRFYRVQKGDTCYDIAIDAGVKLSDFYTWNPTVGDDCSDLEIDTFVCIGAAGTATTITSGAPVPT